MSAVVEKGYYEQTDNEYHAMLEQTSLMPWEANVTLEALLVKRLLESNFAVYDGLVEPGEAMLLKQEVRKYYEEKLMNDGEIGTLEDASKGTYRPEMRTDKILWMEGNEPFVGKYMKRHIMRADILAQKINILLEAVCPEESWAGCGRTKIMATCYPAGGHRYCAHYDNPDRNGRKMTMILYLNEHWKKGDGGVLRMKTKGKTYDVAPLFNRVLVFWSDRRCPHEVMATAQGKDRYAITIWYMNRNEKPLSLPSSQHTSPTSKEGPHSSDREQQDEASPSRHDEVE